MDHNEKLLELEQLLRSYGRVALGFSGGVDSTFLARVLSRCMPEDALLVHLTTPLIGTPEQISFQAQRDTFGLPVLELKVNPLDAPEVAANPTDRCYHCKHLGFGRIVAEATARGYNTVIDGSNADDAGDYRPGMRAVNELGVRSPLLEAGWHKNEERELLRSWDIPVWKMPAGACLATRIPCGEALSREKLEVVRACEGYLRSLGLCQVRVRLADGVAQVTAAPEDLKRLEALGGMARIIPELRAHGAEHINPEATPYVHGAMN